MFGPNPTEGELAILRVLWSRAAPTTVHEVHDELLRSKDTAYTTVLKMLTIMTEKGLVKRDESERAHVYRATLSEDETQRQLVSGLLKRAFGGSTSRLVLQALASRKTSANDLAEIRRLIDKLSREKS